MYLSKLNLKQRRAFLDACVHLTKADGVVARVELDLIEEFCAEMGIKSRRDTELTFDAAIIELNSVSNKLQKKQILFELARLVYIDYVIKPREEQMLKFVIDVFKLPLADYQKIIGLVKDFSKVQKDLNTYFNS